MDGWNALRKEDFLICVVVTKQFILVKDLQHSVSFPAGWYSILTHEERFTA